MTQLEFAADVGEVVDPPLDDVIAFAPVSWPQRVGLQTGARVTVSWLGLLMLGSLAIGGYYLLPQASSQQAVLLSIVNASPIVAGTFAAARTNGLTRVVWISMAAGMLLSTLANVPYYGYPLVTGNALPFPSVVDGFWLMTYPCFVAALWALARQRRGDDHAGNVMDGLIIVAGGGMVLWLAALDPAVEATGLPPLAKIVSIAYPAMDVLVFGMLVRLVVGARHNAAMNILVASFVFLLAGDTLETVQLQDGTYHFGGPCDGLWMISYLLIAVAALHPSGRAFPTESRSAGHRLTAQRLAFLTLAALAGPILLALRTRDVPLVATMSVLIFALVMGRMVWLNRRLLVARRNVEGMTDELRYQALHDALTGLPNRALISDRIAQLHARSYRHGTEVAALFIDLDGFKGINDSLGHDVGDRMLQGVAARLTAAVREADTIGRLGGDEFVVLLDETAERGDPTLVAERILDVLRQPFELDGVNVPLRVTASIGIATSPTYTASELLSSADVALYEAKAAGKDCYEAFRPDMQTAARRRYELELDLRGALAAGEFRLMYQPIYDLADLKPLGFEALLRWEHPIHGMLSPDEFIGLLESTGQIVDVGRWVLREACRQVAEWRTTQPALIMSVNVSGRQLDRESVIDDVRDALALTGLDPAALTIEITETALMNNVEATARRLEALKEIGVQIAIDDFGTGYSSLAYLQQFPVDCLKIDRAFTSAISSSPEGDALIHTLVQLGKVLGLRTLAEGVETGKQVTHLRHEHVDAVQGFLLSRPITPASVEENLLHIPKHA